MDNQATVDREHLKILSICHYAFAGLCLFPFLYGFIYTFMGIFVGAMIASDPHVKNEPPAILFGGIFALVGISISAISLGIGLAAIKSGRNLTRLNARTFSFVFACIICAFMPFGTLLGVFTLIVLSRDSVQRMFAESGRAMPSYGATPPNWR